MRQRHFIISLLCLMTCGGVAFRIQPTAAKDFDQSETLFRSSNSQIWNDAFQTIFDENVVKHPERFLIGQRRDDILKTLNDLYAPKNLKGKTKRELITIQRAAWSLFDALIANGKQTHIGNEDFLLELAKLISATALSSKEIDNLKSNYSTVVINDQAGESRNPANDIDLFEDLFEKNGDWIQVVYKDLGRMAITHEEIRHLRSEYIMLLKFPGGRETGIDYIKKKNEFFSWNKDHKFEALPETIINPVVPSGTIAVVIERMMVLNERGNVQATPLIKSVEINELVTPQEVVKISRTDRFILGSRWKNAVFKVSLPKLLEKEPVGTLKRLKGREPFAGVMNLPNGLHNCKNCHNLSNFISFDGGGLVTSDLLKENMPIEVVENGSHTDAARWKEKRHEFLKLKELLKIIRK